MHAVKGGWVGQTFALAKCDDSGGKKSRIRRSKEDRKALVESFIKKYQKLNNGSFPSLKLTREQVGGSFYTIREIVREVIQENRVLGPATFIPEQKNHDDILEQYPIGSISIEPETELLSSNGSHPVTHILPHHQDASEEHGRQMGVVSEDREILVLDESVEDNEVLSAKVTCFEADLIVETSSLASGSMITYGLDDKFNVVNGSCGEDGGGNSAVVKSDDLADEKLVGKVEVPLEEDSDNYMIKEGIDRSVEHVLNANTQGLEPEYKSFDEELKPCEDQVSDIAADVVDVYNKSSDKSLLNENLREKETGSVADETIFQENTSDLMNPQMIANLAVQQLENCCDLVVEKTEDKVEVPLEENSEGFMLKESTIFDTSDSIDSKVNDPSVVGIKITDPVNHGSNTQSSKDSKIHLSEQTIPKTAIANVDDLKETNPTLNRMNLESWKTLDKSRKPSNPLLLIFKVYVTAFVKFWSE